MVASARLGNSPAHSRCVRQVFPTAESPITSTLKVRQRLIREDTLPTELENSRDDSIVGPRRARRVHEETKAQRKRVQGDLQERETVSNKDAGLSPQKTGLFVCVTRTRPPGELLTALIRGGGGEDVPDAAFDSMVMIGVSGRGAGQMTSCSFLEMFYLLICKKNIALYLLMDLSAIIRERDIIM